MSDAVEGEEPEEPDVDPGGVEPGGKVEYEIADWAGESRTMLDQLLRAEDVPHAWEAGNLVVPASFEVQVDGLVEQVELMTLPTLDPDAPKVAYDIEDWTDEQQTLLMARLDAAEIPYEFDTQGALVVEEEHEERVEDVLDAIEYPEALDADDGDGADGLDDVDAAAVLSDLFVAADRLKRKATDSDGVLAIVDVGEVVGRMRLPYGFERLLWDRIVEQATALKDAVESNVSDDDHIEELAGELRDTLRPVV